MNTADDSKTSEVNPNILVFRVEIDPAEEALLDRWKLQKDDFLFIDPARLIEVGDGFALVKVVGKVIQVERHFVPQP